MVCLVLCCLPAFEITRSKQQLTVMLLFSPDEMWHKLWRIGIPLCLVHGVQLVWCQSIFWLMQFSVFVEQSTIIVGFFVFFFYSDGWSGCQDNACLWGLCSDMHACCLHCYIKQFSHYTLLKFSLYYNGCICLNTLPTQQDGHSLKRTANKWW